MLSMRGQEVVESLYFDYLACRKTLDQVAGRNEANFSRLATTQRIRADAALVFTFLEDDLMTRTLNQSFYRHGIASNTFDEIVFEVTDPKVMEQLDKAFAPGNPALDFATASPHGAQAADQARELVQSIVQRRTRLLPETTNKLWHAPPARALIGSTRAVTEQWRRGRSSLIEGVGRMKNPLARPLAFSEVQREEIHRLLEPGDVILTYSSGWASNLFLPGNFKHAITYVGTPAERARIGLTPERAALFPEPRRSRLAHSLGQTTLETGEPANLVESLAEGVIFGNLDDVLKTRINRLVVLRPRLHPEERLAQLTDVFSFVGDEYDFFFDFADGSDQVCTEVVYRSLQGRGGIDFSLVKRAGHVTLSADDIIQYYLENPHREFACIAFVDEDEQAAGSAKLLVFDHAQQHVARLMHNSERR